jgi:ArsR family transcriptional regulator
MKVDIPLEIMYNECMKHKCCKNKSARSLKQVALFLKIVSEENRLKILCLLQNGQKCVCEIWQALELPQNLVSHHLKVLKNLELISSRKEEVKIFYKLNQKVFNRYLKLLNKFLDPKGK